MPILRAILAFAVTVAAAAGVWLLSTADSGLSRSHVTSAGVPIDVVRPAGIPVGERRPAVVVAHGFAGSARLMAPFGDTLAARGYVVALLDFTGHGANTRPLPSDSEASLAADLEAAVAFLRSRPDVDPTRVALVGHSMGAGAIARYATDQPTVVISLPEASTLPDNLLALVGALEFPGFQTAAKAVEQAGHPMIVVPWSEHISILYAPRTHRALGDWLGPLTSADPFPARRLLGAGLLLPALLLGLYPVVRLLMGRPALSTRSADATPPAEPDRGTPPPHVSPPTGDGAVSSAEPDSASTGHDGPALPLGRALLVSLIAAAIGVVAARLLPTNGLPLAVGGYVVGLTACAGLAVISYLRWRSAPAASTDLGQRPGPVRRRPLLAAVPLLLYAVISIAAPLHLGVTHAVPVGPRWWLLLLLWAGFALLSYAGERLGGGLTGLALSAVVVIALTGAAVVGLTSGFVLLVVPLLVVLLLWQALWNAILNRLAAPLWLIAMIGALVVAWPIAATLPIVAN